MTSSFHLTKIDGKEVYCILSSDEDDEDGNIETFGIESKLPTDDYIPLDNTIDSDSKTLENSTKSLKNEALHCWACEISLNQKLVISTGDDVHSSSTHLYSTHVHPLLR
jgi:hypothetical protein